MKCRRVPLEADVFKFELGKGLEDGYELYSDVITKTYTFGDPSKVGPVSEKLYKYLRGIQDGVLEDPHNWCYFL